MGGCQGNLKDSQGRTIVSSREGSQQGRKKATPAASKIQTSDISVPINNVAKTNDAIDHGSNSERVTNLDSGPHLRNGESIAVDPKINVNHSNIPENVEEKDANPWVPIADESRTSKLSLVSLKRPYQSNEVHDSDRRAVLSSFGRNTSTQRDSKSSDHRLSNSQNLISSDDHLRSRNQLNINGQLTSSDQILARDQPKSHDQLKSRNSTRRDQLKLRELSARDQQKSRDHESSRSTVHQRSLVSRSTETSVQQQQQQQQQRERIQQQSRHLANGFEAMVVLVQYLTNREDQSFQSLCKQLAARKAQVSQYRRQIADLSASNQALSTDLHAARQLIDDVNGRNETLTKESKKLKTEVKELSRFRSSFVSDFGKLDTRLKDLTLKNDQLLSENEKLSDRLKEEENKKVSALVKLNDVTKERELLQADKRDVMRQRDDVIGLYDDVRMELRNIKEERDGLRKEKESLRKERDDVTNLLNDVISERDNAIEQNEKAVREKTEFKKLLGDARVEIADTIGTKTRLEQDLADSKAQLEQNYKSKKEHEQLIKQLRRDLKNVESELVEARQQLSDAAGKFYQQLHEEREAMESKMTAQRVEFERQLGAERVALGRQQQLESKDIESIQVSSSENECKFRKLEADYRILQNLHTNHQKELDKIKSVHEMEQEKLKSEFNNLHKRHRKEISRLAEEYSRKIEEIKEEKKVEKNNGSVPENTNKEKFEKSDNLVQGSEVKPASFLQTKAKFSLASGNSVDSGVADDATSVQRGGRGGGSGDYLEQEVESLRTVLDMRNEELHRLRKSVEEMCKKLEEIPLLRDTVEKQRQQIENLDAVISLKVDYERQLSEKHQGLLRKADRDSKAIKRLSMDKEELVWKLNQSESCNDSRQSLSQLSPDSTGSPPLDAFSNTASMYCIPTAADQPSGRLRGVPSRPQRPKSMVVLSSSKASARQAGPGTRLSSVEDQGYSDNGAVSIVSTRVASSVSNRKVSRPSSASTSLSVGSLPGMEKIVKQRHIEDIAEIRQTDV